MKKILILTLSLVTLITLAGCTSEEERAAERMQIRKQLPEGCKIHELGPYAEFERLVMVTCPNAITTTQGYDGRQSGKSRTTYQYAIIR